MKGFVLIIVGYQGAGKSLLAKKIIEGVHPDRLRILDINNEYSEIGGVVADDEGEPDFDTYSEMMIREKEVVFITEDATTIFPHRGYDKNLVRAIIKKRHSKNTYIFLFHSLRVVPRDVFEYADELWLLKTADTEDSFDRFKGTGLLETFNEVQTLPEFEWSKQQPLPIRDKHYKVLQIKRGKLDKTVKAPQI